MSGSRIEVPRMPAEYRGGARAKTDYTLTVPRSWTAEEIRWCLQYRGRGASVEQIARSVGRSHDSVSLKLKRLSKRNGSYNADHAEEKERINAEFVRELGVRTVLDAYAGSGNPAYAGLETLSNDADPSKPSEFHCDAVELLCGLVAEGSSRFDLVDLDPYGSAYDCLPLAMRLCSRGLAVTFGEMGHRRFRRLDFVRDRYGIRDFSEFDSSRMVDEVVRIGRIARLSLEPYCVRDWGNVSRAWFRVSPLKHVFHHAPSASDGGGACSVKPAGE